MAFKRVIPLMEDQVISAASQVLRSGPVGCGEADKCRLLIKITNIGSPGGSDSVTIRPIWYDDRGREYVDANTTYGTFSVVGNATDTSVTVDVPSPGAVMGITATGAGSLSASTGFKVSARFELISTFGE